MDQMYSNKELELIEFVQKAVQIKSYSNEEETLAQFMKMEMERLGYDEVLIDTTGNVIGRIGDGPNKIQFDSHLDTVRVTDEVAWQVPPFSGENREGFIWGRGSVDMKSALCASIYAVALARDRGYIDGKTVYVTGTVCEEFCDGENLKHLYRELNLMPDYCVICEPSDNRITLGHKGKAQIRITTHGVSAHGSAPEKGINAVYEMAEIIKGVEHLNESLFHEKGQHGTIVLSDISSEAASLNAVPSQCSIYLDRRLSIGETLEQVKAEMDQLIEGKRASWEVGTLYHTTWKGKQLTYEPMHDPWKIEEEHPFTKALERAYVGVTKRQVPPFDFWDFGTNAITPVSMGVPTIGFGPGDYKLAHMRDERCEVSQIVEAYYVYSELLANL